MNIKILHCKLRDCVNYNDFNLPISFVNKYLKTISKISIKFLKKIKVLNKILNQLT